MKRLGFLYDNICKMENIQKIYDEVCTNTKNRAKVNNFKQYKCAYISKIYDILINRKYVPAPLNTFVIYETKQSY